jgi:hypothetical protein
MMGVSELPPKMTQEYASRAALGDYQYHLGSDVYVWFVGNQKVCVIGLVNPTGHIEKMTSRRVEQEKASLAKYGRQHVSQGEEVKS